MRKTSRCLLLRAFDVIIPDKNMNKTSTITSCSFFACDCLRMLLTVNCSALHVKIDVPADPPADGTTEADALPANRITFMQS